MESDRRLQIQRSLRTLAESYKATIELMEQTVAMICDQGAAHSFANANFDPLLQNTITIRNLTIDPSLFSVTFRGKVCFLGNSYPFKFLCRLALRPNVYVAYEILLAEVWRGTRSDAAVRSAAKILRFRLRQAGLTELANAIDGSVRRHYSLKLVA